MDSKNVMVEIVAKLKGCMMCDLAIAILKVKGRGVSRNNTCFWSKSGVI